jgi:type IV pilus assembly protein PilM
MNLFQKKKKSGSSQVGLEIESGSIAAAEVQVNGTARLTATATAPLPAEVFRDGEVADPGAVTEALSRLFSEHKLCKQVRLGIANQRVVVRTLRLPAIEDPKELFAAVRFSAQEQIAMPLEQAVIDHRVVGGVAAVDGAAPQIDVIVVAARRDMISASLKPLRDAGLEPIGVDLSAFGMIRALGGMVDAAPGSAEGQSPSTILYCNIGDVTNLAVAKGRACLFTRVSPVGLGDMAASLASTTELSNEHALMWLTHVGLATAPEQIEGDPDVIGKARSTLEIGATSLLDELRLSLDFYAAQEGAIQAERIVLCGPGSVIPGLANRLEPALGIPIELGQPEALAGLDTASAARLTLPFGLALEH